jgi:ferredoxin
MPKVTFVHGKDKQEIEVPEGGNLRQEALKHNVSLYRGLEKYANCRGLGVCGTCKVLVKAGGENLSKPTLFEKGRLALMPFATIGHEGEMRLACQTTVNGDCTVETKPGLDLEGENFWQKPWPNK